MSSVSTGALESLWIDLDAREALLRRIVTERLVESPPPRMDDHIVATYFFALRSTQLSDAAEDISYLATSGVHNPPAGSLLDQCSAKPAGIDPFDATGKLGLAHVAIPLKMMQHPDGHVTSTDIMHTIAGAGVFDLYERQDARLVSLQIPDPIIRTFPGPAYGAKDLRALANFPAGEPAFGTILKPTAGITPEEVEALVEEAAQCPLFLFVKEDEDLYPDLDYSPVRERARRAMAAIDRVRDKRGGRGIIFAPHITGSPHEILDTVFAVLEQGVTGLMFSETFATGAVRMIREATRSLPDPPAIYGHNAGIGVKTRAIWREVIDLLARLDGIDFRQTAPLKSGDPFLRPYGDEWRASESTLSMPLPGIKPTMIVRAGGLDQGNIGMNLDDVTARGLTESVIFLAGSAINSIKDKDGRPNPRLGAQAMLQAIEAHRAGALRDVERERQVPALLAFAAQNGLDALSIALRQRYPEAA